jgi:hypothetical protein
MFVDKKAKEPGEFTCEISRNKTFSRAMLSTNMLIENLRQNITSDGSCVREHLDESRRLLKIPIHLLTEDDYEAMNCLQGQFRNAAQRMRLYDKKWYELHSDLKGVDDCYKIIYRSKELFRTDSPMNLAACAEDAFECLRSRMERWRRYKKNEKNARREKTSENKVFVQYNNRNHS